MNYTAIGSSVNLAKRLQEAAAPGQILLSDAAYRRVQKHINARSLPPIEAQGFKEPIEVYELQGLK
jgi:adenylate cyclase